MTEFELIRRYFTRPPADPIRVPLGVGDDCALLAPKPGMQLAISSDMLVEGRHFLSTVEPDRLGHKALAVNLSDLAACGARPLAFTLALALPEADADWLEAFARGLLALADAHGCALIGGDVTRGPLNICITAIGEVPAGLALRRDGARPGDEIWVSGTVGDARLALEVFRGRLSVPQPVFDAARRRMECPEPRVALGLALRGLATSAIDISDGLAGDLGHVLAGSGCGATIAWPDAFETIAAQRQWKPSEADFSSENWQSLVLAGGDDYELCFTAAPERAAEVEAAAVAAATPVRRIGRIDAAPGLRVVDSAGHPVDGSWRGFDHFG